MATWAIILILLAVIDAAMLAGIRYEGRRMRRGLRNLRGGEDV